MPADYALSDRERVTTILNYIREVEENVLRVSPIGAMAYEEGRIRRNTGGTGISWRVMYQLHNIQGNDGTTPRTFAPVNQWKEAKLDPNRGCQGTDKIYRQELLSNQGREALIAQDETVAERLTMSVQEYINQLPYKDGNKTGNEKLPHGMESFLGTTTAAGASNTIDTSATAPSLAKRAYNADDIYAAPDDTYAELDTDLAAFGGVQKTGIWPRGITDEEADAWSPTMINYKSNKLGGTAYTWREQSVETIRRLNLVTGRNKRSAQGPRIIVMDHQMMSEYLDRQDAKERATIGPMTDRMRAFGFQGVSQEGLDIIVDYWCPSDAAYMFSFGQFDIFNRGDKLYDIDSDDKIEIETQAFRIAIWALFQFRFRDIRCFGAAKDYSTGQPATGVGSV